MTGERLATRAMPRWLQRYQRPWLADDARAGLTSAAVVIPQAIAYASLAGLPVQYGLYCALVPALVYAAAGTSRALSVSTTSTVSLLTATGIAYAPSSAHPAAVAAVLAIEVGGFLVLAGFLKMGFVSDFISRPVLVGFKAGMALTIAASQLGKLLGIDVSGDTFLPKVRSALSNLGDTNLPTLLVALVALAALLAVRRWRPTLPGPLLVMGAAMVVIAASALESRGVETVPRVAAGLPDFAVPDLSVAGAVAPSAAGIALMVFVESIAAARAFRGSDEVVLPDRELVALGLGNAIGGLFHAYPSSGGLSQTAVNAQSGARSQLAGAIVASISAVTLVALTGVFSLIPEPVLGSIVLVAAIGLIDLPELRSIRLIRAEDWAFAVVTAVAVLLLGTLQGVVAGIVISLLTLLHDLNHPPIVVLSRRPGTDQFRDRSSHPEDETFPGLLIVRVEAPLYFCNAPRVLDRVLQLVQDDPRRPRVLLVDGSAMSDTDVTALSVLAESSSAMRSAGTEVWLAGLTTRALAQARHSARWAEVEAAGQMHRDVPSAVQAYLRAHPPG